MNLLDKYIQELGKHLPRKSRTDIQFEIRSTLEDMLEEKSAASGKPVDDALIAAVLKEYGSPKEVAATYREKQYLIGPSIYPTFVLVVKIVSAVVTGGLTIAFALNLFTGDALTGAKFVVALGEFLLGLVSALFGVFGNIAVIFAILERVLPASEFDTDDASAWDPAKLAAEPDPDAVNIGEEIAGIVFTAIFLSLLNLYPEVIGIFMFDESGWSFVPGLSDGFFQYMPFINILGVAGILFSIVLLQLRTHTTYTRLVNLLMNVAGIVLAVFMLTGPALVAFNVAGTPLASAGAELEKIFNFIPTIVLMIVIIVQSIEVVQDVIKLFKKHKAAPYPISTR